MKIKKPHVIAVFYVLFLLSELPNLHAINDNLNTENTGIVIKNSIPDYISIYSDYSMDLMKKYNMPASVILAQGVLESNAGNSDIAITFNNHFNILCDGTLPRDNCYKDFENPVESFENHVSLMKQSTKYNSLFEKKNASYNEWAYGLAKFGGKNETYVKMIIYYIEKYRLYKYDLQVAKENEQDTSKEQEGLTGTTDGLAKGNQSTTEVVNTKADDIILVPKVNLSKKKNVKHKVKTTIEEYIASYQDIAMELMKTYKMPASIILAQGLVESNRGNNSLAVENNNDFGILCDGTSESEECYKKYDNPEDSFSDHVKQIVQNPKYTKLFTKAKSNYIKWAYGLKKYGYATDKNYPKRLMYYIEKYKLYQFDDKVRNKKLRRGAKKDKFRKLSGAEQTAKVHEEQLELKQQAVVKDSVTNTLDIDKEKSIINADAIKPEKEATVLDTEVTHKQELATDDNSETAPQEEKSNDSVISENTTKEENMEIVASTPRVVAVENTSPNIYESQYYIVQPKDTYYSIAKRYGISVRFLKELNSARSNLIIIGQSLKVVGDLPDYKIHHIVKDDTLYNIASCYGVTIAYLKTINNIGDDNLIYIGDELKY